MSATYHCRSVVVSLNIFLSVSFCLRVFSGQLSVGELSNNVCSNQRKHSQVQRTCGEKQCPDSMPTAPTNVNCRAYSARTMNGRCNVPKQKYLGKCMGKHTVKRSVRLDNIYNKHNKIGTTKAARTPRRCMYLQNVTPSRADNMWRKPMTKQHAVCSNFVPIGAYGLRTPLSASMNNLQFKTMIIYQCL